VASVSITNIETGMTLAPNFVANGRYETDAGRSGGGGSGSLITCKMQISGSTVNGVVTDNPSGTGGDWEARFAGVPIGIRGVLTARLSVAAPPPDAQASDLTVTDGGDSPPFVNPPPPPPPPI
jgi:hypothetical protein